MFQALEPSLPCPSGTSGAARHGEDPALENRWRTGMTLIELVLVFALIGVMLVIGLFTMDGWNDDQRIKSAARSASSSAESSASWFHSPKTASSRPRHSM